jgi:prepilin peptidase CpaA
MTISRSIFDALRQQAAFVLVFPLLIGYAALCDLRRRQIPNWLSGVIAVCGIIMAVAGAGPTSLKGGLGVGFVVLVVGLVMQSLRVLGGGDTKLFAAASIWLGPATIWTAVAGTAIAGGVVGFVFLRRTRHVDRADEAHRSHASLSRLQLPDGDDSAHVPYAVAIAIGCLWAWAVQLRLLSGVL